MRPPRHAAHGISVTVNVVLLPPPPPGLIASEGRAAGEEEEPGRQRTRAIAPVPLGSLRRAACCAIAARTPPASDTPTTSESACGCRPRPGNAPAAAERPRSCGTPTDPPP